MHLFVECSYSMATFSFKMQLCICMHVEYM